MPKKQTIKIMKLQDKITTFINKIKNNFSLFKKTFPPEVIVLETKHDTYEYFKKLKAYTGETTKFIETNNLMSAVLSQKLLEIKQTQKEISKIEIVALMDLFTHFHDVKKILEAPSFENALDTWFHKNQEAKKLLEIIYDAEDSLLSIKGSKKNSSGGSKTDNDLNEFFNKLDTLKTQLIEYQTMAINEAQKVSPVLADMAVDKFTELADKEKAVLEETQNNFFADMENSKDEELER